MKRLLIIVLTIVLVGCGNGNENSENEEGTVPNQVRQSDDSSSANNEEKTSGETPASERVDLKNKGVGPVKNVDLGDEIDQALAQQGEKEYKQLCTACHQVDNRFVGPSPQGVLERRTPEWVMNMILNPEVMVEEDPLAKDLFIEFNQSPMTNQNLSREQARAIIEYFRTL